MTTIKYQVSGLTCNGCVNRVKTKLSEYADDVEVSLTPPEAILTNPNTDIIKLNAVLAEIGNYKLLPITTELETKQSIPKVKSWISTYKPLLLVFSYIILITSIVEVSHRAFDLHRWMTNFMAGFFIVFSFFKLLDLAGFANSYAMYDLLAKKWSGYGYIYPFLELGLGIGYALTWQPLFVNSLTILIMGFSTIGVVQAVLKKQSIQCACLGTGFNLPMTTVTIVEDLLMVAMAAAMII
jgi:copper chaperone CopZ